MFSRVRKSAVAIAAVFLVICGGRSSHAVGQNSPTLLDAGYRDMYNLQFNHAHTVFSEWQRQHPQDPLGPVSDAAAYLFSEFDRLHVLEFEFFTDDNKLANQPKLPPDPAVRQTFEVRLTKAQQLADAILQHDPKNSDALFANVLVLGLRGDYVALIDKRYLTGLGYMKRGRALAEQLLAQNPGYYDAYLAVGIENYLLSIKPAPVRWLLRLGGAETDKATGLEKLEVVAQKGHYMLPYARLLLAVAALRDNRRDQARNLLQGLAQEFPNNHLYAKELAQLQNPQH